MRRRHKFRHVPPIVRCPTGLLRAGGAVQLAVCPPPRRPVILRLDDTGRARARARAPLKLDDAARRQLEAEGRKLPWRFKLEASEGRWDDPVCGAQHVDEASQSDPVVVRADGSYLYSFTALVDDIDFGITHVIRGEDDVTNTGAQIQMFQSLGAGRAGDRGRVTPG